MTWTFQVPSNTFSDPEGTTLTYSATRADGSALPDGCIFTPSTRTFTWPSPTVGTYSFQVTVNDTGGLTASDTFDLVVTQFVDIIAPTITSPATATVAENSAFAHELTADEPVTWTITGGADAAQFSLVGSTLSMTEKDREIPADANADNAYVVTVTATDAADNSTEQTITVTVTDVFESVAMTALLTLGGVGVYIDFTANSMAIVDPATPANNYDGPVTTKMTYTGAPPSGVNGGLVVSTAKYAQLATSLFGYTAAQGSMGCEYIRSSVAGFAVFMTIGSSKGAADGNLFRSGSVSAGVRFACGAPQNVMDVGESFVGLATYVAGFYQENNMAAAADGGLPTIDTSGTVGITGTTLWIGGSGAVADYAEILRCWWIPTLLPVTRLSSFVPFDKQTFYIDSVAGSDASNGLTTGTAVQTIAGALAKNDRPSDKLALKYGSRFHSVNNLLKTSMIVEAYGTAADGKPIIDGSVLVNGAWSADGTYANVKKVTQTVTLTAPSQQPFYPMMWWGDAGLRANPRDCRATSTTSLTIGTGSKVFATQAGKDFVVGESVRIWDAANRANFMFGLVTTYSGTSLTVNVVDTGGSGTIAAWVLNVTSALRGYWAGADIAANRAYVNAHPGTFTCHKTGSTAKDPAVEAVGGTSYDYYIRTPNDSDPASAGVPIYVGEHKSILSLTGGQRLTDLILQRSATKDLNNKNNSSNLPIYTTRVELLDASGHGIVASPAVHVDGYARGLQTSPTNAQGGGWHFFRDNVSAGTSPPCSADGCVAESFAPGFYSHGTGGGSWTNQRVDLLDCESVDCNSAVQSGGAEEGWHITNHVRTNAGTYALQGNDVLVNSP